MLLGIELHIKCSVNCKGSQIARSCWLWVILLKSINTNFKALTMTYRICYNSFRCCTTAKFHLLQIPSISHSRQELLPCAVVYQSANLG